jgi:hypothetical protein
MTIIATAWGALQFVALGAGIMFGYRYRRHPARSRLAADAIPAWPVIVATRSGGLPSQLVRWRR